MSGPGPGAEPPSPEALVGKDEIDEDDEMELSGDDLIGDEADGTS